MALISHSTSTPRKVRALLSSFILQKSSEEKQSNLTTLNEETELARDEVDSESKDQSLTQHKRVFQPNNKAAFFQRVETYTAFTWFDHPAELTPLLCARYGWENIEVDTLKCVSCKEVLYAGVPESIENAQDCCFSDKLIKSIVTAHSSICPWPTSPCSEKLYLVMETTPKATALEFVKRIERILLVKDSLPVLDLQFLSSKDVYASSLTSTIKKTFASHGAVDGNSEEEVTIAAFLSLFGWTNNEGEASLCPILVCQHCKRHAGLWNFTSHKQKEDKSVTVTTSSEDTACTEPEAKRRKTMEIQQKPFNPSAEHRDWCPWITNFQSNSEAQSNQTFPGNQENRAAGFDGNNDPEGQALAQILKLVDSTAAGWKQVAQMLERTLEESSICPRPTLANTTPPNQAWKTVKRILGFFQGKTEKKA